MKRSPYPFKDAALKAYLDAQKIPMFVHKQYFDAFVLSRAGVATQDNREVKRKLGFTDEQPFTKSMLDAVTHVASTSMGDDCGEGFRPPDEWSRFLASLVKKGPQTEE